MRRCPWLTTPGAMFLSVLTVMTTGAKRPVFCLYRTREVHVTLLPPAGGKRTGKNSPWCSSSRTILPRRSVVIRQHRGYSSEGD